MQIKWGIIGTGYIANAFAKAMDAVEDGSVVAVASRAKENAKKFAAAYGISHAYGSYQELMESTEIDAVYIATPHSEHFHHASEAIRHNKHVLCEKPLTLNGEDAKELARIAKANGVFFMEAMWTKFLPVTKAVKEWVRSERIGSIKFVDAKFGFVAPDHIESRLYNKELGGGALLDVGIYPITYALEILGRGPDGITSCYVPARTGVDAQNSISFTYEDGTLACLQSSVCAEIGTDAVIVGDDGRIVIYDFYGATRAERYDADGNLVEQINKPFAVNGYEYEIREVNACIKAGKLESDIHPLMDTERVMGILDRIRQQWGLVYPGGK